MYFWLRNCHEIAVKLLAGARRSTSTMGQCCGCWQRPCGPLCWIAWVSPRHGSWHPNSGRGIYEWESMQGESYNVFLRSSLQSDSPLLPAHSICQSESLSEAYSQEEWNKAPILRGEISKNLSIYLKTTRKAKRKIKWRREAWSVGGGLVVIWGCHLGNASLRRWNVSEYLEEGDMVGAERVRWRVAGKKTPWGNGVCGFLKCC